MSPQSSAFPSLGSCSHPSALPCASSRVRAAPGVPGAGQGGSPKPQHEGFSLDRTFNQSQGSAAESRRWIMEWVGMR